MIKKIFITLFLILFTYKVYAQDKISYYAVTKPLKSQMKNKYSAYEISFTNISNNVIKADSIQCLNKVNMPDLSQNMKFKKGTKWALALCPFTLGMSCLGAMPEINERNQETSYLLDEQQRYTSYYGDFLPITNAALKPGEIIKYNILVPINERPRIQAVFQDLTKQEYFNVNEN